MINIYLQVVYYFYFEISFGNTCFGNELMSSRVHIATLEKKQIKPT